MLYTNIAYCHLIDTYTIWYTIVVHVHNRALINAWGALDARDADLDVMDHPLLNIIYYTVCEILPSAFVLYILRKLPPKKSPVGYQPIPAQKR